MLETIKNFCRKIANPSWVDKSANQMRAQITNATTDIVSEVEEDMLTGEVSATTVTRVTNWNAYAANLCVINKNQMAWADNVRARIT
jgi:hypothetical protein